MITISLCMIVKNEEKCIGSCLKSVEDLVDEIIIVDTGSTDKTKDIVKEYTNKIYDFPWIDDFSAARNFSFSKASSEYIFWLDADDILKEEDRNKLKRLKEDFDSSYDAVSMRYNYAFNEAGYPTLTFRRNRIVKRSRGFKWCGFIHEYISVDGKILDSDINVSHMRVHGNSDRNINIFRNKVKQGYKLNARDTYYYGKELYFNGMSDKAIEVLSKVPQMNGWYEEKIQALITLADIYLNKGFYELCRKVCYESFEHDTPRAEAIYRIALSFQQQGKYTQAIRWYEVEINLQKPNSDLGFIYEEYWTWLPHLQLCVCYFKINDVQKAYEHNEAAYKYNPSNKSILNNMEFFNSIGIIKNSNLK